MPSKQSLIGRINALIFVTEENRKHLIEMVEKMEEEKDLQKIEELIQKEDQIIVDTIKGIVKSRLEAGDTSALEMLDKTLSEAKGEEAKGRHIQEEEEHKEEEEEAEEILKKME